MQRHAAADVGIDLGSSEIYNKYGLNDIDKNAGYTHFSGVVMDLHTPEKAERLTLEADRDCTDYQWWVARTADSGWDIESLGHSHQY